MNKNTLTYANIVATMTEKLSNMEEYGLINDFRIDSYLVSRKDSEKDFNYIKIFVNERAYDEEKFPVLTLYFDAENGKEFNWQEYDVFDSQLDTLIRKEYEIRDMERTKSEEAYDAIRKLMGI